MKLQIITAFCVLFLAIISIFNFPLKIELDIGLLSFFVAEGPIVQSSEVCMRLPHSIRGLGSDLGGKPF